MICATCRDQEKLGLDPRPRFGGVFELRVANSSDDGYWGERWELYKVSWAAVCPENPSSKALPWSARQLMRRCHASRMVVMQLWVARLPSKAVTAASCQTIPQQAV